MKFIYFEFYNFIFLIHSYNKHSYKLFYNNKI